MLLSGPVLRLRVQTHRQLFPEHLQQYIYSNGRMGLTRIHYYPHPHNIATHGKYSLFAGKITTHLLAIILALIRPLQKSVFSHDDHGLHISFKWDREERIQHLASIIVITKMSPSLLAARNHLREDA